MLFFSLRGQQQCEAQMCSFSSQAFKQSCQCAQEQNSYPTVTAWDIKRNHRG